MYTKFLALISLVILAACGVDPIAQEGTGNGLVVQTIGEHKGCTIHRFRDYGHHIYFVLCPDGKQITTTWNYRSGKTTKQQRVPTKYYEDI